MADAFKAFLTSRLSQLETELIAEHQKCLDTGVGSQPLLQPLYASLPVDPEPPGQDSRTYLPTKNALGSEVQLSNERSEIEPTRPSRIIIESELATAVEECAERSHSPHVLDNVLQPGIWEPPGSQHQLSDVPVSSSLACISLPGVAVRSEIESERSPESSSIETHRTELDLTQSHGQRPRISNSFKLLAVWKQMEMDCLLPRSETFDERRLSSLAHIEDVPHETGLDFDDYEPPSLIGRLVKPYLLSPTSSFQNCWIQFGSLVAFYELIMIPTTLFRSWDLFSIFAINWAVRVYWLVDVCVSMVTCYDRPDGRLENRPEFVAHNYLTTWFPLDAFVISLDWIEYGMGDDSAVGTTKLLKTLKALRLLRMIRMSKKYREPERISYLFYQFHSETFVIAFGIFKITVLIAWITHFISCCWLGLGADEAGQSWLNVHNLAHAQHSAYTYATAYHWSITQFIGSMEVYPVTLHERIFANIVLLLGFSFGACAVSTITTSMTRLQIVAAHQASQVSSLRQYLHDNCISSKLALRVQRHALDALALEKKRTPESSIELISLCSEPMKIELHFEIFKPVLTLHPMLMKLEMHDPTNFRRICHTAVSRASFTRGDIVFCAGDVPEIRRMQFVVTGHLKYSQYGDLPNETRHMPVHADTWIGEPLLWTEWVHVGDLRTVTECSFINLLAAPFQSLASKMPSHPQPENPVLTYAREFIARLNELRRSELVDLDSPDIPVWEITGKAFPRSSTQGSHSSGSDSPTRKTDKAAGMLKARSQTKDLS